MIKEIWKRVKIEKLKKSYKVSNMGRVMSVPRIAYGKNGYTRKIKKRILKTQMAGKGYLKVTLYDPMGNDFQLYVHRLVAETFIPNPENKPEVNHKDLDKTNNRASNLEWSTDKENVNHAYDNGAMRVGEKHCFAKMTDEKVSKARNMYKTGKYTQLQLAKMFGVAQTVMGHLLRKNTWKHVA